MSLDRELFMLVNQHWTHPALDWWSALVSATGLWTVPALVVIVLVAWRGTPRARTACALSLVVFALGDRFFVRTLKEVSSRPRPAAVLDGVRRVNLVRVQPRFRALAMPLEVTIHATTIANQPPRSFPSGHAWNSFAIATVLTLFSRRWGWLMFLPALGIGFARIHAGLHWPTDVLASMILGPACTLGLVVALERTWLALAPQRWRERLPPLIDWYREREAPTT